MNWKKHPLLPIELTECAKVRCSHTKDPIRLRVEKRGELVWLNVPVKKARSIRKKLIRLSIAMMQTFSEPHQYMRYVGFKNHRSDRVSDHAIENLEWRDGSRRQRNMENASEI